MLLDALSISRNDAELLGAGLFPAKWRAQARMPSLGVRECS